MLTDNSASGSQTWLWFALLSVACWGLYGAFLHTGQMGMHDPVHGRYKAFLWVGVAYFLTAVLAPLALLYWQGATWDHPWRGIGWSLVAGLLGAMGAFGVLLAFGAKGTPPVVMSIVFAGAPVVNALYSLLLHPPSGGLAKVPWPFALGIVLAALGGCLVTLYKPAPAAGKAKPHPAAAEVALATAPSRSPQAP